MNRLWRLVATAISFALFGAGGLVLGVTWFPLLMLFVRDTSRRTRMARRVVSGSFRLYIRVMRMLGVYDYEITGLERAGELDHCLIVANHPTLVDVVFLLAMFDGADCVVKRAMWSNPFAAITVRAADYVPNNDPEYLITECVERLTAGARIILFPEGTRSVPGKPLDFRRGAASIAVRAGASVLPVRIGCDPVTLTKGEPWYRIPVRKPFFRFAVLAPVHSNDYLESHDHERAASGRLNEDLAALLGAGRAV